MGGQLVSLEAFEVRLPLPRPLRLGAIEIPDREYTIVRARDDEGHVGSAYGLSRNAPLAALIARTVAPYWRSRALDDHPLFYAHAVEANVCLGPQGVFWRALGLADCALYDLLATRAGRPLYDYLGGGPRRVPALSVGGYPSPDETAASLAAQVAMMLDDGPAGIKIASCSDYARDTPRLRVCRAAMPDDLPLMIDLHWGARDAAALLPEARVWEGLRLGWIEDPVAFDDVESMAQLADQLASPIAVGDEQSGHRHILRLMDEGRIDVLRLDATACGGVRAFVALANAAAERGLPVSCHVFHHLHAHLAAAAPNVAWVEYMRPELGIESIHLLWDDDLRPTDGGFLAPPSPGVGYAWDEDAIEWYRRKGQDL